MDYSSMKATKVATKRQSYDIKLSSKDSKNIKKAMKSSNVNWLVVFLFFICACLGGFFGEKLIFKNDVFEMVSSGDEIDVVLGGSEGDVASSYVEKGVKCVAFGKDYSDECTVKYFYRADLTEEEKEVSIDQINLSNPGIFYAVYSCPNFKYKNVTLIRNIIVLGGEDNG